MNCCVASSIEEALDNGDKGHIHGSERTHRAMMLLLKTRVQEKEMEEERTRYRSVMFSILCFVCFFA